MVETMRHTCRHTLREDFASLPAFHVAIVTDEACAGGYAYSRVSETAGKPNKHLIGSIGQSRSNHGVSVVDSGLEPENVMQ